MDERELEQLVYTYQDSLLRYCTGILGNQMDAQDAVQQTFIKAWRKQETLRQPEKVKSWLYRIAYCTCIDMLRQSKETAELTEAMMLRDDQVEVDLQAVEEERGISLRMAKALASLSPLSRAIMEERILEELSYEEMSAIHHLPQTVLRSRYSRARKKLQSLLQNERRGYDDE